MKFSTKTETYRNVRNLAFGKRVNRVDNELGAELAFMKLNNRYLDIPTQIDAVNYQLWSAFDTARVCGAWHCWLRFDATAKDYLALLAYCLDNGLTDQDLISRHLNRLPV